MGTVYELRVKTLKVADVPKARGMGGYVLQDRVHRSGATLRIRTRLARAGGGYLVRSAAYDRPFNDKLMVQDDIASEGSQALRAYVH